MSGPRMRHIYIKLKHISATAVTEMHLRLNFFPKIVKAQKANNGINNAHNKKKEEQPHFRLINILKHETKKNPSVIIDSYEHPSILIKGL